MKNFTAIIVSLFFFSACSASGPRFQETSFANQPAPADKARIIFLREDDRHSPAPDFIVTIDGVAMGKLEREGFLVVDAVPGERELSLDKRNEKYPLALKLNLEAAQTYYIQVSWRDEFFSHVGLGMMFGVVGGLAAAALADDKGPIKIEPIDPAEGKKLLSEFRLSK